MAELETPDVLALRDDAGRFGIAHRDGRTFVEGVALERIAAEVGTPTYVYGLGFVRARYRELAAVPSPRTCTICYAVKANGSLAILRQLAALGAGADIVSAGELARARAAGIPADRIVFSGVGKRDDEIDAALTAGIRCINVESSEELERVAARAHALGVRAPVALRVNPEVDPVTHPYLATGLFDSKFGIPAAEVVGLARKAAATPSLDFRGLAFHIGSQIAESRPYLEAAAHLARMVAVLREGGVAVHCVDLGGGTAIPYAPGDPALDLGAWRRKLEDALGDLRVEVVLAPGRALVGNAGVLLTRVLYRKQVGDKRYVIVDAAMNDLIRPALYDARHAIVPVVVPAASDPWERVDVVGPVCECGDFLAHDRPLHRVEPGALLAVLGAGAYGMSMASTYNARPLPAEVVVDGDRFAVVRPRAAVEALYADERVPEWVGR